MLVSRSTYGDLRSTSGLPITYSAIYVNVPGDTDANAATASSGSADRRK